MKINIDPLISEWRWRSSCRTSIIIGLLAIQPCAAMMCKGSDQQDVDWWIALKAPHGSDYVYIETPHNASASNAGGDWAGAHDLNAEAGNLLANTVQQIYTTGAGYALYNDEWPNGTASFHLAHAKGVIGFGAAGGFWLLHSAPRFPSSPNYGPYTGICCGEFAGQLVEGQSFLCMSLTPASINRVAQQLLVPTLYFYDWHLPAWSLSLYPEVVTLLTAGPQQSERPTALGFATVSGQQLIAFHKPTTPLEPIAFYEDVLEPGLRIGLEVQSWLNGWNPLPSSCPPQSQYESLNIRHVYIREVERGWETTTDHSKWAISIPDLDSQPGNATLAVCIGDMNRMQGQLTRGGGAVCFTNNAVLWQSFRGIIAAIEGCSTPARA